MTDPSLSKVSPEVRAENKEDLQECVETKRGGKHPKFHFMVPLNRGGSVLHLPYP